MNSADSVMSVIAALIQRGAPRQHGELAVQIAAVGLCSGAQQSIFHGARAIDDARQAAGQHIERHPDGRDEENGRQRDLDEVRNIEGWGGRDPRRLNSKRPVRHEDRTGRRAKQSYCLAEQASSSCALLAAVLLRGLRRSGGGARSRRTAAGDPVELGISAAIAAAAIPKDNRAEAINLVMGSPAKGFTSDAENTPDRRNSSEMKIISRSFGWSIISQRRRRLLPGGHVPVEVCRRSGNWQGAPRPRRSRACGSIPRAPEESARR